MTALLWGCSTSEKETPAGYYKSPTIASQQYTGVNEQPSPKKPYANKTVSSGQTQEMNTRVEEPEEPEVKSKQYKPAPSP
jgi:hypothetical protein